MKKWKDHWNELLPYEKRFEVATEVFISLFLIFFLLDVLAVLHVVTIDFDAFAVSRLWLVAGYVCQTVVYWRIERKVANSFLTLAVVFGLGVVWDIVKLFL